MSSVQQLYELAEPLSLAEKDPDGMAKLRDNYVGLLEGTKVADVATKRLCGQFIARFFAHFPDAGAEALDAFFDLCEDEDDGVRLQAIRDLPVLCKVLKEFHPKIVDVLAQLLQTEEEAELRTIQGALMQLYKREAAATLKGLFCQVRTGSDEAREKVIRFLSEKLVDQLAGRDAEMTLLLEIKGAVKACEPEDFTRLMSVVDRTKIPSKVTGQTQLLEITASLAGLEDEGPFDATDPEVVNKFAYCADQATKYVSAQVRGTKFFEYLSCRVLPQLREVEDANRQTGLLKFLAEFALHTGDVAEPAVAAGNIFQRLVEYMPKPQVDGEVSDSFPELEFTKVECLLIAYHSVAKQLPQGHFDSPDFADEWKDFKLRLQYFARCSGEYQKRLKEALAKVDRIDLNKGENKTKQLARDSTSNIIQIIRDLCHPGHLFKASVVPSWKKGVVKKSAPAATVAASAGTKRKSITFEGEAKKSRGGWQGEANGKSSGGRGRGRGGGRGGGGRPRFSNEVYEPPTGKYSGKVDRYSDGQGERDFRGGGGRGGWRGGGWRGGRGRGGGWRGRRW